MPNSKMPKLAIVLACGLAAALLFPACRKNEGALQPGRKPGDKSRVQFPVEVLEVKAQSLIFSVTAVGAVEAFEKVQVTARVSGVVDRVLFVEGRLASVDQVLVEIEPERYRLAVESAEASYQKALASKADAEAGLKRRETAVAENPGLIPGEEIETWKTKVLLATSDVAQSQASLNQAKLNLRDAYVRAPFSGIIETRTVQTGQYVQVGSVLATLVRREPLMLRFRVPERDAARMKTGMKAGFRVRDDDRDYEAVIVHVAGAADEGSRLVAITAEVRNPGPGLRPGTFTEITIPVGSPREMPVIPQTAIRPSERGFIAYVVENDTAVERIISLGMRTVDGRVEVLSGLSPGESIVIRGAEALRDGAPVRIGEGPSISGPERTDEIAPETKVGEKKTAEKPAGKPAEKR